MSRISLFSLILCISLYNTLAAPSAIVCYYATWANYRFGNGTFEPEDIDANTCTHVNYAFLGVHPNGTIKILDEYIDVTKGGLQRVSALKEINPELKTIISIGGVNAGPDFLNDIVVDPQLRTNLVESTLSFLEEWNYDGLDISWIYPHADYRDNFTLLLSELRDAFVANSYTLSTTIPWSPELLYFDIVKISNIVDFIHLMAFDYFIPNAIKTGHNAPLYSKPTDNPWGTLYANVNGSVSNWIYFGADPSKLTLGLPFYGHTFNLSSAEFHGVGDGAAGPGIAGQYTRTPGIMGFNEICYFYKNFTRVWDQTQMVPYKYQDNQWVSYDDEESIALKVQLAIDKQLAGVMIWAIDTDDFNNDCPGSTRLLEVVKNTLSQANVNV